MKIKKYLNFTSLRKIISEIARSWPDSRRIESKIHSIHDVVLSAFACMYFQEPSLLQFQKELEDKKHQNNLRTLFNVKTIPSSNAMKEVLDKQDHALFTPIFKSFIGKLQRGKQLEQFELINGMTIHSIDATMYHSSTSIHCPQCLTKKHKDNPTVYQHFALQGAIMHPDMKQVIPTLVEPIKNIDGTKKQDCETNAAKRYIPKLRKFFPKKELIITGDDLFSRQPMIETVIENNFHFFFVAKPTSHTYMTQWLDNNNTLNEVRESNKKKRQIILYQWVNKVPLHGGESAIDVNYFCKKTLTTNLLGKIIRTRVESWVTDLEVTEENVILYVRGAKARWKVENECFNTLKNQGYNLSHNYGHGEKNLSFNFYLLTVMAFAIHQISELCDIAFQVCRKKAGSKRSLWEKLRTLVCHFIFETMEQLLKFYLKSADYNIIDGYVLSVKPPSS
jgi:hypothetical protein